MITRKTALVLIIIAALAAAPVSATVPVQETFTEAKAATGTEMAADLLAVRPVGIVATLTGTVIFVLALPFTLISGDTQQSLDKLVTEPGKFTFNRPLGRF